MLNEALSDSAGDALDYSMRQELEQVRGCLKQIGCLISGRNIVAVMINYSFVFRNKPLSSRAARGWSWQPAQRSARRSSGGSSCVRRAWPPMMMQRLVTAPHA